MYSSDLPVIRHNVTVLSLQIVLKDCGAPLISTVNTFHCFSSHFVESFFWWADMKLPFVPLVTIPLTTDMRSKWVLFSLNTSYVRIILSYASLLQIYVHIRIIAILCSFSSKHTSSKLKTRHRWNLARYQKVKITTSYTLQSYTLFSVWC